MKPLEFGPWGVVFNATTYGPSCMQSIWSNSRRLIPNTNISEDCLQLNIYVPRKIAPASKYAVMVYVHGGSFVQGQGTSFDGSLLALRGDIIVVTINYRLNVFGYLSTDDPRVKGNIGLYDQQMAFRWVNANIADYGGDQRRITIFGHSAGSLSVTLHAMLPQNMGLFQRVIGQSGSGLEPSIVSTIATKNSSLEIAIVLGCAPNNMSVDIQCMQSISADDLFTAYRKVKQRPKLFYSQHGNFYPVIDDELIHADLIQRLHKPYTPEARILHSVDLMIGSVEGEGGWIYWSLWEKQKEWNINPSVGIDKNVFCNRVIPGIVREKYENCTSIMHSICKEYSSNVSIANQTQMMSDMVSDMEVVAPTILLLDLHSITSGKSSYQYLFSHLPAWELDSWRPAWLKGPNHGSEVTFVAGLDWYPSTVKISPEERALSDRMMDFWSQFAKTGNPNGSNSKETWPSYTLGDRKYLDFDLNDSVGAYLHGEKIPLWNRVIPEELRTCIQERGTKHKVDQLIIFGNDECIMSQSYV
ncbi:hypothetical protein FSP39_005915 [Pinctada imbricata]|uniref:Carboxylesterase type B domain-containing protein n=1 Tax=Pinctada imbricata TaxID=66713 RepID=A0AA89BYU0_PINIB|nr:hypothetical protein FSP39_005915 [Pinctada imbricata]